MRSLILFLVREEKLLIFYFFEFLFFVTKLVISKLYIDMQTNAER